MRSIVGVLFGFALFGCGSAELVLKAPVVDRCSSAKLKGCEEMADGVIAYVDGKKDDGRKQIVRGAAKNAPKEVAAFATSLRTAAKMPGIDSYADTLKEIADLLETTPAGSEIEKPEPRREREEPKPNLRAVAGTASIADAPTCSTSLGPSACARIMSGPATIETLVARCSVPLAIIAGDPSDPHWQIVVPANQMLQASQLALPIADAERFTIAAANGSSECSVTWVAKKSAGGSDGPDTRR